MKFIHQKSKLENPSPNHPPASWRLGVKSSPSPSPNSPSIPLHALHGRNPPPSPTNPQTHTPTTSPSPRAGFSLIEIMVATTILVIIVMMVAMVFQQSSLAWQGGIRRADGNMMVRSLMGIIQREISQAVDARAFGMDNVFTAQRAEFIILSEKLEDEEDNVYRAPRRIEYSFGGSLLSRSETALEWRGNNWTRGEEINAGTLNSANQPLEDFQIKPVWDPDSDTAGLPLYVEIEMKISQEGGMSGVEVWSYGPNERNDDGEEDDIRSW